MTEEEAKKTLEHIALAPMTLAATAAATASTHTPILVLLIKQLVERKLIDAPALAASIRAALDEPRFAPDLPQHTVIQAQAAADAVAASVLAALQGE